MKLGDVASNPRKIKIMETLLEKELSISLLIKKTHTPEKVLRNLVEELKNDGLIEVENDICKLTDDGLKTIKKLKEDVGGEGR